MMNETENTNKINNNNLNKSSPVNDTLLEDIGMSNVLLEQTSLGDFSSGSDENYEPSVHSTFSTSSNESMKRGLSRDALLIGVDVDEAECSNNVRTEEDGDLTSDMTTKSRKRIRKEQNWDQNKRKFLRNSGQEYKTIKGVLKERKGIKPITCTCKLNCNQKFNDEIRKDINRSYWSLEDYGKQRLFINNSVIRKECIRKLVKGSRRNFTFEYKLQNEKVCKQFYLATLNISDGAVMYVKRKEKSNIPVDKDRRGMQRNAKKISEELLSTITDHIRSFPSVESHYSRKTTTRRFLASDLNTRKMYELYQQRYPESVIKEHLYRKVFNTQFNFSFHVPKKDACKKCVQYKNATDKSLLEDDHKTYIQNKELARNEKYNDKLNAQENIEVKVYTFDLQSVLYAPCSNVSSFYYTRKLASYNLTIYDLNTKEGFCNFWMEIDGQRGSDEVDSILFKHLQALPNSVKHLILYSDCCGGQNRNRFIAALHVYCIRHLGIDCIEIKYLESGHTQMEVDSMHSTIEKAKKGISIYSPTEWPTILRIARRKNPYKVNELSFADFYDLKYLFSGLRHDLKRDSEINKIPWMQVKCLKVSKDKPDAIEYKTLWEQENFLYIDLNQTRKPRSSQQIHKPALIQKYKNKLEISNEKKKYLLSLCKSGVLPSNVLHFYENLPAKEKRNRLAEPDYLEEDENLE